MVGSPAEYSHIGSNAERDRPVVPVDAVYLQLVSFLDPELVDESGGEASAERSGALFCDGTSVLLLTRHVVTARLPLIKSIPGT